MRARLVVQRLNAAFQLLLDYQSAAATHLLSRVVSKWQRS